VGYGDMFHMQLANIGWHLNIIGALIGLAFWVVATGFTGWLLASIYNRLL